MPTPLPHDDSIGYKLHKLNCLLERHAMHILQKKVGLTFSQFRILMVLHKHNEISQKQIAEFHGLTEAAISRMMEVLRKKGLISRKENPRNRREKILTLTDRGHTMVHQSTKVLEKALQKIFSLLENPRGFIRMIDSLLLKLSDQKKKEGSDHHAFHTHIQDNH